MLADVLATAFGWWLTGCMALLVLAAIAVPYLDRLEAEKEARDAWRRPWDELERRRIFERTFEENWGVEDCE